MFEFELFSKVCKEGDSATPVKRFDLRIDEIFFDLKSLEENDTHDVIVTGRLVELLSFRLFFLTLGLGVAFLVVDLTTVLFSAMPKCLTRI